MRTSSIAIAAGLALVGVVALADTRIFSVDQIEVTTVNSAGQVKSTLNPTNTTNTSASVLVNPTACASNEPLLGVLVNGTTEALIDCEGDLTATGTLTLGNSETLDTATDAVFKFSRNDTGIVTLTCADNDATCAMTLDPGGAAALVLGSADVTSLTVTTDSTGTAEVALPTGSIDGTELEDGAVTLPDMARAAHATFTICGDATTVNNNTVYYGPSAVVVAGYGRTCDITQAGNATENTADEVVSGFPGITAAHVTSMVCLLNDPGATVSLTLRTNAGATTPSVTCSIADNATGCVADVQTTTVVDLTLTAAIAAASTADMGTAQFHCTVDVVF